MSTLTNIELRINKLESKVRRLECQTCSSPLFYDTFEDFPTEGRNGFLYVDKETGGIYIWNGEYITLYEEKICLNETEFVPADVNNPTTEEVKIWTDANLSEVQKNNGTVLTYFVDDYIPFQNNLEFYFSSYGAENSTIDYFTINSNSIISNPIPIKVDGEYVYDSSFETIVENWLLTNGFEGDVILDLDNQVLILQHIRGGNINAVYGYSENGDSYEENYTSYETVLISGNGGTCNEPDFTWTLNDLGKITLDYKRTFNTKTVYVDVGSGSDVTGKRGYRNFPFKTLNAAIPECQTGDTLYVFPGDYSSSVQATVLFNIYCESGVNWNMTTALYNTSLVLDNNVPLLWKFHYLYSSNVNGTTWQIFSGVNYISFIADTIENMCIGFHGIRCSYDIINSINSTVRPGSWHSTVASSAPSQVVNIKNVFKNKEASSSVSPYTSIADPQGKDNTQLLVNVENVNIEKLSWQGIYALGFFVKDAGINKNYTYKNKNINFYPTITYDTTPLPFAGDDAWKIGKGDNANYITWFREGFTNGTTINFEVDNYRGTGNGLSIQHWNWDGLGVHPTEQRVINIKLKGYWEKGVPVCLAWNGGLDCTNCTQNTVVNIDLDVICETSPGVMFSFTGGCHQSHRFNISGKIVTKAEGMPCIIINSTTTTPSGNIQTNGTINLKDLLLINDGTIAPIAINPLNAQVQEVNIMNVKSNSLIVDANITEVGESIVRNINYK